MELSPAGVFVVAALALLIGGGAVAYLISIYNTLVQMAQNIQKTWNDIDVLLQQRHDELLNLVEACKGYMKHEREVLTEVTRLRAHYDRVPGSDQKAEVENLLNQSVGLLHLRLEAYPDLKASQNLLQLQGRISALESGIADRRELFNDSVNIYNIQTRSFPDLILARLFAFRPHTYLEVPDEFKRLTPVSFA